MLTNYEKQYINIVKNILKEGYYDTNRTGVSTYKLPHQLIHVDLEKEFPILRTKFVAIKTAIKEIMWIMKDQSNVVQDLRDQNVQIWNEWEQEDGTIGHAYGYIVKKYKQIDKLLYTLKNNPQDRRMIINLWDIEELPNMALQPCCFLTMWDVTDGRLNCMLTQRSGDIPLGVPFNTTQYAVLTYMIAHATGLKPGVLTHVINNAHIYENQLDGMREQVARYDRIEEIANKDINSLTDEEKEWLDIYNANPTLKLNEEVKDFYNFSIDDVEILDYKRLPSIKMPVAV